MISEQFYHINILKTEKPNLNNFIINLENGLKENYKNVSVTLTNKIPNKTNYSNINSLGTNSVICDLGGELFCHNPKYRDVSFDIDKIDSLLNKEINLKSKIITGSGCGHSCTLDNHQGELYYIKKKNINNSYSIRTKHNKIIIDTYNNNIYGGLGNLNFYDGKKSKNKNIIKICVKKRIGNDISFTKLIQKILEKENILCGLSGFINIKNGLIKSHIQPDYKDCPENYYCCKTDKNLKGFLHFSNIDTKCNPINCITSIWNRNFKNDFEFRKSGEHTHFISENLNVGGHYHFDLDSTKDFIEYEAYLVFSNNLIKIRNPILEKPSICIIGSGAMGCLFGGILKHNGLNVTLIDKWKKHINTINNYGLELFFKNQKQNHIKSIKKNVKKKIVKIDAYTLDNIPKNNFDIIIIQTKSLQTLEACKIIKNNNLYHNNTCFISFQNGLGNEDIISKEFNYSKNIFGGQTLQGANIIHEGAVNIHTNLPSYIGEWNGNNYLCKLITNIFTRYGIPTIYDENIKKRIWMKFIYNCVVSPLSALTNLSHKNIYNKEYSLYIANNIIKECLLIAKKEKIKITKNEGDECLQKVIKSKQDNKSSMCYDINNNNKSELEFINGKIVELSKKHNIKIPINTLLYFLIKGKESTF